MRQAAVDPAPQVSVVIPHYRDLRRLDICLRALERQVFPRERFEIVVADNASPEGEDVVAAAVAGRARLVIVAEKGAGPARNGGVAASRGEILAFIDSDCVAEPQWLEAGVRALAGHDFVGGRVEVLVEDASAMTAVECYEKVFAFDFEAYITRRGFTGSGNMFCPRAVFEIVGGFDNGVSEDVDWSHRAIKAGFTLGYAPEAAVGHPARRTWAEEMLRFRRVHLELFNLARRRRFGRVYWLARSLLMPASALVHSVKVLRSPKLHGASDRAKALGVLYRVRFWRLADGLRLLVGAPA